MTRDYSKKKTVKRKPAATPRVAEKKSFGGLIYMLVGLSIGLFIAFLVYLDQQPIDNSKKLAHPAKPKTSQAAKIKSATKSKVNSKTKVVTNKKIKKTSKQLKPIAKVPKYEFYTMLPDVEIEVNVPETIKKTTTKTNVSKPATNKTLSNEKLPNKTLTNKTVINKRIAVKPQPKVVNRHKAALKSANKKLYQLQVGAFQAKEKAESMKAQLAFMGVQSNVSSSILTNGKKVYKVRIGPSSDEENIKLIKTKLKQMNINTFLQKI
jgi:cell division protein FtsN